MVTSGKLSPQQAVAAIYGTIRGMHWPQQMQPRSEGNFSGVPGRAKEMATEQAVALAVKTGGVGCLHLPFPCEEHVAPSSPQVF